MSHLILHLHKSEEMLLFWVYCTNIFMFGGASWYGYVFFGTPRVIRELNDMPNGSVFFQYYKEHMDTNSPFSHEQSVCGTRYQTGVFLRITTWFCLRRGATPTFLNDRVIFDVIGGSPDVRTSPYLFICF